ncbi:MAG: hypothetical protein EBR82_30770 [Caulobacteraceae bacterium]|nr:hypothetical protein [Caulobacteraceae bacterium]
MKTMFEFDIYHEKEVEKVEVSTNEKGEEVKVTSKVKTTVPVKLAIKKPTRSLFDEAELFYGVRLSEGIKAGLLTRALLAKRFNNDGGVLSEEEQKEYNDLYNNFLNLQVDFQKLSLKQESLRTEEEKSELAKIIEKMTETREMIQKYEMAQANLFEQTAENRARNKTIMWWVLQLSLIEGEDKKLKELFGEGTYEDKLKRYDEIEESELGLEKIALQKLLYLISFWYIGRAATQEEFSKLLDAINKDVKKAEK